MQKIETNLFTMLVPDKGYKIVNKSTGKYYQKLYLGKNDSIDNYGEVVDEKYINMDYVVELDELKESMSIINEQNNTMIDLLLLTIDELYVSVEPFLATMPMTMNLNDIPEDSSRFIALYALMINRDLKNINDIPERFKEDVKKLL